MIFAQRQPLPDPLALGSQSPLAPFPAAGLGETEIAQGRLPDRLPEAVIDIGSNSVRLVVYEGLARAPTLLFNEKILCGLGRGLAKTGRLDDGAVQSALGALRRFHALAAQAGAARVHVLATAAAREAENGAEFIAAAEALLKTPVRVLSGHEEAYYSALGVVSAFHPADGITGDLGGGSLELIDVRGREIGEGVTLPLGGLRLVDLSGGSLAEAARIARKHLAATPMLANGKGRNFYAVGGTWRNLAKLHMSVKHYPLHVMHGYEIVADEALSFLKRVAHGDLDKMRGIKVVSKNRRGLLSYGASVLLEVVKIMKPQKIVMSALGVREGYLYSLLSAEEQSADPLISAAEELALLRSRSPLHARELADWTGTAFSVFGVDETEEEARCRRAACLLADISWRAHPDYRGPQAFNLIAHGSFIGVDHPGRAYIALANFYRHEGLIEDALAPDIVRVATPRILERARLLGALLRVVYLYSASMPGVIPKLAWRREGDTLTLVVPAAFADLLGERPEARLQQLAKLTGKTLRTVVGEG